VAPVGIVGAWLGYALFFYGLNLVKSGNDGFMSLIWPGKYKPTPRDVNAAAAANPPGYGPSSKTPGGSPSTPPTGWLPVPAQPGGTANGDYYSPAEPGEIWVPGQGVLQQ
jgi:hypothetical protein